MDCPRGEVVIHQRGCYVVGARYSFKYASTSAGISRASRARRVVPHPSTFCDDDDRAEQAPCFSLSSSRVVMNIILMPEQGLQVHARVAWRCTLGKATLGVRDEVSTLPPADRLRLLGDFDGITMPSYNP